MTAKKRKFWNIPPEEEQTGLLLWFQILQKHYLKLFGANAIAVLSLLPCAYFVYLLVQTGDIVFWGLGLALFVLASDRKSTRLNSSHDRQSRMPSSA